MIYLYFFALLLLAVVTGSSWAGKQAQHAADAEFDAIGAFVMSCSEPKDCDQP